MTETTIAVLIFGIFLLVMLAIGGLGIANYAITALSLSNIAEDRRIKNSWLAWLPVLGSSWIIGSISDYHDGLQDKKRKWRVALLVLELVFYVSYAIVFVGMMVFAIGITVAEEEMLIDFDSPEAVAAVFVPFIVLYILMIISMLVAVAWSMCRAICIYKIFEALCPEKAVKYILLSLLVPLAMAICLLKIKNSTVGIPQPPVYIPAPVAEPVQPEE